MKRAKPRQRSRNKPFVMNDEDPTLQDENMEQQLYQEELAIRDQLNAPQQPEPILAIQPIPEAPPIRIMNKLYQPPTHIIRPLPNTNPANNNGGT